MKITAEMVKAWMNDGVASALGKVDCAKIAAQMTAWTARQIRTARLSTPQPLTPKKKSNVLLGAPASIASPTRRRFLFCESGVINTTDPGCQWELQVQTLPWLSMGIAGANPASRAKPSITCNL